jgi:hypothetical protein
MAKLYLGDLDVSDCATHFARTDALPTNVSAMEGRLAPRTRCCDARRDTRDRVGSVQPAGQLGSFHNDPADRILVATARLHDLVVITADDLILRYRHVKTLSALR